MTNDTAGGNAAKRQDGDVGGACHRCGQYPMRWWGAWGRYICGSWWHMEGGCSWD